MDSPETNQKQISSKNRHKIKEEVKQLDPLSKIKFYDVRELYLKKLSDSLNKDTEYTPFAALRLLAPFVINNVNILLYLDCDTLVCEPLYELFYKYNNTDFDFAATAGLNENGKIEMFLTTSLLFNLKYQRKTNYKSINNTIKIYNCNKLNFPDQEAITKSQGKKLVLPSYYNMGIYDKKYTRILCVFYRQSEQVKNHLQRYYPHRAQKILENIERIINEISEIQFDV